MKKGSVSLILMLGAMIIGIIFLLPTLLPNNPVISKFKSFLNNHGYFIVSPSATLTSSSSGILVSSSATKTLEEYNLTRLKNKKWTGNISSKVNGTMPGVIPEITKLYISMNYTIEIDELYLDLDNLDWAKQTQKIGITNTNTNGLAISIAGKGRIKYQNPWKQFVSNYTELVMDSNPLEIKFIGYIDPKNKILFFNEAFTNKPIMTATERTCYPPPISSCISPTKSFELIAKDLWLRGMTYEFGKYDELILKKPIWDLTQEKYLEESLSTMRIKGNVKTEASGLLKIKY